MCFEGGERAGSARRYLSSLFRLVTFYRSTYIFVSSAFLTFLDTSGIVYRLASSVSLSFGDYCPSISQNIFISVFLFAFSHYFSFSFFLTLIRILFARSLKILRISSLAIRFSLFLFHFTVLSDLYYSFAARASTSLPLCVTTLYWREQRDIRYLFLSFLCVISMPPAKIYAYPPRYISFAGYL